MHPTVGSQSMPIVAMAVTRELPTAVAVPILAVEADGTAGVGAGGELAAVADMRQQAGAAEESRGLPLAVAWGEVSAEARR